MPDHLIAWACNCLFLILYLCDQRNFRDCRQQVRSKTWHNHTKWANVYHFVALTPSASETLAKLPSLKPTKIYVTTPIKPLNKIRKIMIYSKNDGPPIKKIIIRMNTHSQIHPCPISSIESWDFPNNHN